MDTLINLVHGQASKEIDMETIDIALAIAVIMLVCNIAEKVQIIHNNLKNDNPSKKED